MQMVQRVEITDIRSQTRVRIAKLTQTVRPQKADPTMEIHRMQQKRLTGRLKMFDPFIYLSRTGFKLKKLYRKAC